MDLGSFLHFSYNGGVGRPQADGLVEECPANLSLGGWGKGIGGSWGRSC